MRTYKCHECGEDIEEDEVVWVDPDTGEATTGDSGRAYHVECAPEETDYDKDYDGCEGSFKDER